MRNGTRKEFFLFLLLLFLSGFLFFLDKKGWLKPVRGLAEKPILAIEKRIYALKFVVCPSSELTGLQIELQRLVVDQNALSSCLEENAQMRRLLGAPLPAKWKFLPAMVVGLSEQMRIDKGEKDNVLPGMMVVSENILVGKIISVGQDYSLVQLPVTPGVKIPVMIKSSDSSGIKARGLLVGQYGNNLILDRVLQEEEINKGDIVTTSGEGLPAGRQGWLPDLVIGQISEVLPKSAEIFQKAQVKPLVDYNELRIVFIVI